MAPKVQQDEDEDYEEAAGGTPAQREADQQIFSVSKKTAEHCIDFDLKKCLNQSFCEFNENYTRAGVVTYAATVIFGKAVDYVFDEGCAMRERLREKNANKEKLGSDSQSEAQAPKTPAKRGRARKLIDNDKSSNGYTFEVKAHKTLPADQIDENFQRQKQLSKVDSLKIFFGQQAEKGGKKGRLVLPKRFKLQQVQQAVNSKFDDQIYDYAKDDVIGSRKDFAIFSYWMDSTTGELTRDINFKKHFARISRTQIRESVEEHLNNSFSRCISPDDRNNDLPLRSYEEPLPGLRSPDDNFDNLEEIGKSPVDLPEIFEDVQISPSSMTIDENQPDPLNLDTSMATALQDTLELSAELNASMQCMDVSEKEIDEINRHQPSLCVMDLKRSSPNLPLKMHQIMDLQEDIHFAQSIIPIKDKIVANAQDFVLPAIFHTPILKHNLFNLPLKKLTKMRIFELPKCEFSSLIERKKNQNKSTLEKTIGQPRMFKVLDVNNSSDVRSVCSEASVSLKLLDFTELEGGAVDVGNGMLVVEDKDTPCMEFCIDVSPTDSELAIPSLNGADQNESQKALKERKRSTDSGISDEGLGNETLQITVDESRETDITFSQDKTLPNSQSSNESGYESIFSGSQSTSMIDAFDSTIVDASRVDLSKYSQEPAELAEDLEDMNSSLNPALRQSNLLDAETQKRIEEWRTYLRPILKTTEKRNDFDINDYQKEIINKIGHIGNTKTFAEVEERPDCARYFLTCLMMMNNANVSMDITQKDRSMPVEPESIRLTLHSDVLHSESLDTISETLQSNKKRKETSSARPSTSMPPAKKQKLLIIPEKRQIEMVQGTSTPLPKKSKLSRISEFVSTSAIGRIWNDLPPTKSRAHSKIRDSGYSCSVQSPTQSLPDEMF